MFLGVDKIDRHQKSQRAALARYLAALARLAGGQHMLTIYTKGDAFRVVSGSHVASEMLKGGPVREYTTAREAFNAETRADVRGAILRIDPTADTASYERGAECAREYLALYPGNSLGAVMAHAERIADYAVRARARDTFLRGAFDVATSSGVQS